MKKFSFINKVKLNNAPKKMFLLKQISLLMATAFILLFAVWAWFASNKTATASGIMVSMSTSNTIEISLDGRKSFHQSIDLMEEDDQQYINDDNKIKDKLKMKDITSDGLTFLRPTFLSNSSSERIPNTKTTWQNAEKNSMYISQSIVFRTLKPSEIYLSGDTKITTSAEEAKTPLVGSDAGNISRYGNFSSDCIVGALRLSAVDGNGTHLYTYIPRPDIEMIKDPTAPNIYDVKINDDVSQKTSIHTYYKSNTFEEPDPSPDREYYQSVQAEEEMMVTSLGTDSKPIAITEKQDDGDYYEATATINIWLEGCDSETTQALSGGKYAIALNFEAIALETTTTTNSDN